MLSVDTSVDSDLWSHIETLNNEGDLAGDLVYEKINEAASGVPWDKIMQVFGNLEKAKSDVKDPNAFVCAALRKEGGQTTVESVVRRRVGHLNSAGGLDNRLKFQETLAAAAGLTCADVISVFDEFERSKMSLQEAVDDPTACIISMLRNMNGGGEIDGLIRKQVAHLNKTGSLQKELQYQKIADAARGLSPKMVKQVFGNFEGKKDEIKDPTAFVCHALRKEGGGRGSLANPQVMNYTAPYGVAHMIAFDQTNDIDNFIRKEVRRLNTSGDLLGEIQYQKVSEAAIGLTQSTIEQVFRNFEKKGATVKDPTAFISSALRKEGGGGFLADHGYAYGAAPMVPYDLSAADIDGFIRKQVGRLNKTGELLKEIHYQKVADAARGVSLSKVQQVFGNLELKKDTIQDPTAFVSNALRKEGGGGFQVDYGYAYGEAPMVTYDPAAGDTDGFIRKQVGRLNKTGELLKEIQYQKVADAARGVSLSKVQQVFGNLELKKDTIQDPTAFVSNALRKEGGGGFQVDYGYAYGEAPMVPYDLAAADVDGFIRKQVGRLNKTGELLKEIHYQKVADAARGVSLSKVQQVFGNLDSKKDAIQDPTAFVSNALRNEGGGHSPPIEYGRVDYVSSMHYGRGGYAPPMDYGASYGAPMHLVPAYSPMANDYAEESMVLRKGIARLNNHWFQGSIRYDSVVDAASGLPEHIVAKALANLESKASQVKDPTAFLSSALRKEGGGSNKRLQVPDSAPRMNKRPKLG